MTTNLLAAIVVTLSTNTVEKVTSWSNHVQVSCPDAVPGLNGLVFDCLVIHYKGVDPNEKTITTTAKRTTTLSFDWMGKTQAVEHVEVMWESNRVVRLEWREISTLFRTPMSDDWSLHGTLGTNVPSWASILTNAKPLIIYAK